MKSDRVAFRGGLNLENARAGINLHVGLWKGPTEAQLSALAMNVLMAL